MKTKIIVLISVILSSCGSENEKMEKPFIVVFKNVSYGYIDSPESYYEYQDKNGNQRHFFDWNDKYNVGDTLK